MVCMANPFTSLPRDVQLRVISKFDMDARIKCGIIGKLRIPGEFVATLSDTFNKISHRRDSTEVNISPQYMIFVSRRLSHTDYHKCIVHIRPSSKLHCYYLNSVVGEWRRL